MYFLLHRAEFEGFSEDETVRVVVSGNQLPMTVDITDEAMVQGPEVSPSATNDHYQAGQRFA